jgi:hypothetical protein
MHDFMRKMCDCMGNINASICSQSMVQDKLLVQQQSFSHGVEQMNTAFVKEYKKIAKAFTDMVIMSLLDSPRLLCMHV